MDCCDRGTIRVASSTLGLPTGMAAGTAGATSSGTDAGIDDEYQWERQYERSWDTVGVDASGRLTTHDEAQARSDRTRKQESRVTVFTPAKRGLLRHLVIALDCSDGMSTMKDLPPSRLAVATETLQDFVDAFFAKNPVASVALVAASHGTARTLARLTNGPRSVRRALEAVDAADDGDGNATASSSSSAALAFAVGGDFSLVATIEASIGCLESVPSYGKKEVLLVYGAISTKDTTDISAAIDTAKRRGTRVSAIGLSGELYVCKRVTVDTGGSFHVALHRGHLGELFAAHLEPPGLDESDGSATDEEPAMPMEEVGFPRLATDEAGVLVPQHVLTPSGYDCPRCRTRCAEIPCKCGVCGLRLMSASHLARSYHHVFPVQPFAALRGGAGSRVVLELTEPTAEAPAVATALLRGDVTLLAGRLALPAVTSLAEAQSALGGTAGRACMALHGSAAQRPQAVARALAAGLGAELRAELLERSALLRRGGSTAATATVDASEAAAEEGAAAPHGAGGCCGRVGLVPAGCQLPGHPWPDAPPAVGGACGSGSESAAGGVSLVYASRSRACQGCSAPLASSAAPRYVCRQCLWTFCESCDTDIHEALHVCPGCPGSVL